MVVMPGQGSVSLGTVHEEEDIARFHRYLGDRSKMILEIPDTVGHTIL